MYCVFRLCQINYYHTIVLVRINLSVLQRESCNVQKSIIEGVEFIDRCSVDNLTQLSRV